MKHGYNESNFPQAFKRVVVSPDYDTLFKALNPTQPPAISFSYKTEPLGPIISCDKCGSTRLELYPQLYVPSIEKIVCKDCDIKLFDLLDGLPGGCPENGFRPGSFDYLSAYLIVDAFFTR